MKDLKTRIIYNISKNGFPEKKVSLPYRSVLDACKQDNIKISDLFRDLEKESIFHSIKEDKIIFHDGKTCETKTGIDEKNPFGIPESLFKKAMEQMSEMDPEQLKEIQDKVKNMSPDERESLMRTAKNFFKKQS